MAANELLNAIQKKIIEIANISGISLQDEFKTVEEFKKFVIALAFKALVDAGLSVQAAYDAVFGNDAYNKLAEDVYSSR